MTDRPAPRPGELWLVRPRTSGPDAIVAVTLVDRRIASVCLADSDPEQATSDHLVFAPGEAAPWVVRVLFDVVTPVALERFVCRVGVLPLTADELADAAWFEPVPSQDHRRGRPLPGRHDPRWTILEALGTDFGERFTEPCEDC